MTPEDLPMCPPKIETLGKASEKKYGIIWEPLVQKKNYGLFCVLGPKEHF